MAGRIFTLFIAALILAGCNRQETEADRNKHLKEIRSGKYSRIYENLKVADRLKSYFDAHKITPVAILNNVDLRRTRISIENHEIEWAGSETNTKVRIDGRPFSLKGEKTLNFVTDSVYDDAGAVNNWSQIRYYKYQGFELLFFEMHHFPIVGIGGNYSTYLVYDLKRHTKAFFGNYQLAKDIGLYRFSGQASPAFVAKTWQHNVEPGIEKDIYQLFEITQSGRVTLAKAPDGKPYQLSLNTRNPNTSQERITLAEHWFEPVK